MNFKVGQTYLRRDGLPAHVSKCNGTRWSVGTGAWQYEVDEAGHSVYGVSGGDLIERMERVYIAGPMSGYADLNFPAFNATAATYRKRGAFVINPAEINGGANEVEMCAGMTPEQYQSHWRDCMVKDIAALVTCDTIVMLPNWEPSKGASLEHHIAVQLGMTVCYVEI